MDDELLRPTSTPYIPQSSPEISSSKAASNWRSALSRMGSSSSRLASIEDQEPEQPLIFVSPAATENATSNQSCPLVARSDSDGIAGANMGEEDIPNVPSTSDPKQRPDSLPKLSELPELMSLNTDLLIHLADIRASFNSISRASLHEHKKIARVTLEQVDRLQKQTAILTKFVIGLSKDVYKMHDNASMNNAACENLQEARDITHQVISQAFKEFKQDILSGLDPFKQELPVMKDDIISLWKTVQALVFHVRNIQRQLPPPEKTLDNLPKATVCISSQVPHVQQQQPKQKPLHEVMPAHLPTVAIKITAPVAATESRIPAAHDAPHYLEITQIVPEKSWQNIALLQEKYQSYDCQLKELHADISTIQCEIRHFVRIMNGSAGTTRRKRSSDNHGHSETSQIEDRSPPQSPPKKQKTNDHEEEGEGVQDKDLCDWIEEDSIDEEEENKDNAICGLPDRKVTTPSSIDSKQVVAEGKSTSDSSQQSPLYAAEQYVIPDPPRRRWASQYQKDLSRSNRRISAMSK
ncbi:hypothetical protein BGW41_003502 [Actinomortierella wolfii]|nr:hypothetical protein BGW41_003502 [Actinomortierella wolfii]